MRGLPKAVYIHIPFCRHICPYCDFNKVRLAGQPVWSYLEALQKEMAQALRDEPRVETIFIGGGTPTALSYEQMRFLLRTINGLLPSSRPFAEFTVEANPGTVDEKLLEMMFQEGVNRLSFGVQSFDQELLSKLGRIHTVEDVYRSLQLARQAGFTNLSIDLMFGLPGQRVAQFEETISRALALELPHLSAYSLKIEEGTPFYKLYRAGKLPLPDEDEEADMYELVIDRLEEAGYRHYEISNFARPGFESRHNLTYWRNEEYYGFGAGAHGYVGGVRYMNAQDVREYIRLVEERGSAQVEAHPVSQREAMEETIILGLRLAEGIKTSSFRQRFGLTLEDRYGHVLEPLLEKGLLAKSDDGYRLTKRGLFLGNEVFLSFLEAH